MNDQMVALHWRNSWEPPGLLEGGAGIVTKIWCVTGLESNFGSPWPIQDDDRFVLTRWFPWWVNVLKFAKANIGQSWIDKTTIGLHNNDAMKPDDEQEKLVDSCDRSHHGDRCRYWHHACRNSSRWFTCGCQCSSDRLMDECNEVPAGSISIGIVSLDGQSVEFDQSKQLTSKLSIWSTVIYGQL